jgi:large subunit ribosomal protein L32e
MSTKESEKMNTQEKKKLLKTRKKIKQRRPHFKRFESWRFVRIKDQWRKPRGIDNHMRTEEKGWPKSVKVGYRGPVAVRGLHPSGYQEAMIWNIADLEMLNPEIHIARIGGSVGRRKREAITTHAIELNIKVLNPLIEQLEDDFKELEDDDYENLENEETENNEK